MIAVDTNVLVRLLTWDDPEQAAEAKALFSANDIFVAKTVLLETEWVLRSLYALDTGRIAGALRGLLGLPRVRCEDRNAVEMALRCFEQGLDFADALHLTSSVGASKLVTFDQRFRKRGRDVCPIEIFTVAAVLDGT
jgi:predicted nucleic-acid-binding protein